MKLYSIKEIYYTIQGEGHQTGRPAIFCRFAGCNLWSGREEDRAKAICQFCDTDFIGTDGPNGGKYDAKELARKINSLWPNDQEFKFVVFTGGEPLLQLDERLIACIQGQGFSIAVETNGTIPIPDGIDWVCVSPKAGSQLVVESGDELKLVFPQHNCMPEDFIAMDFIHFYLQPMDNEHITQNIKATIEYCLEHPQWKLSLQSHKYIGIP